MLQCHFSSSILSKHFVVYESVRTKTHHIEYKLHDVTLFQLFSIVDDLRMTTRAIGQSILCLQ